MNKYTLNTICALLCGLIAFIIELALQKYGASVSIEQAVVFGLLTTLLMFILLIPAVFKKIKYAATELDWAEETVRFYQNIPAKYRQSFWLLFAFINLAFLFHTINFMWGNQDWRAVRFSVDHTEALNRGAFSAYWLQELLFNGKILPVANNLWSFAGLSLAGVLLAICLNLPARAAPIVITGLLLTVTPFTLSVMYSAKTTLGICWAPAISLSAVLLANSTRGSNPASYLKNIASVVLFLIALGISISTINFILVAVIGSVVLKTAYADISLKDAFLRRRQALANLTAALLIYLLILFLLKETDTLSSEHAAALNFTSPLLKLPILFKYAVLEFVLPLPFMDTAYKFSHLLLVLFALFALIVQAPTALAAARALILLPLVALASVLSLIFTTAPSENFTEICFFGLPAIYALSFALIIKPGAPLAKRLAYILAILLIFLNFVRAAYAQKVWKFGYDAESKLAERIITRLEKLPNFDITQKYTLLQIGEKPLRAKYYIKTPNEMANNRLLNAAWYPEGASSDAYNFFYQEDIFNKDDTGAALKDPEIRNYLLNRARPWPAQESLFIKAPYIVIILDDRALALTQQKLR